MSYTPVELRHVKVGRSLLGYNRATVEQLIEEVAQSFEATWRERGELTEQVESLEKQIAELRGREHLLTQTLVAAEQAASDVRERARGEAETIVREAHREARAIGRAARSERERLVLESRRIEGMLRAALGMMETEPAPAPAPVVATPAYDHQPAHVPEPIVQHEVEPETIADYEPEPVVDHEPEPSVEEDDFDAVPLTPAAPEPEPFSAPAIEAAPRVRLPEPEPEFDSEYGWAREDTREFEPISSLPKPPPVPRPEPEHHEDQPATPVAKPVLEPIPGISSHDFDWGE